ncbi:MAG: SUMF1/EgtB/PvdO family nonheme iron enzyme, partial [Pseudomonadota bacterium]
MRREFTAMFVALFALAGCAGEEDETASAHLRQCASESASASADVPGGRVLLGERRFYPDEGPEIEVEVAPFKIDVFEVTNDQFRAFVDATGYVTRAERGLPEHAFDALPSTMRAPGSAVFTPPLTGESVNPGTW